MARADAHHAIDLVMRKMGLKARRDSTLEQRVVGGDIDDLPGFLDAATAEMSDVVSEEVAVSLARNYGTSYRNVLVDVRNCSFRGTDWQFDNGTRPDPLFGQGGNGSQALRCGVQGGPIWLPVSCRSSRRLLLAPM